MVEVEGGTVPILSLHLQVLSALFFYLALCLGRLTSTNCIKGQPCLLASSGWIQPWRSINCMAIFIEPLFLYLVTARSLAPSGLKVVIGGPGYYTFSY